VKGLVAPSRHGHFTLESGYHTDLWLTLDELFCDPTAIAPSVEALAERLRPHRVSIVCGPLLGGAFLAQSVATLLGARFAYTEPASTSRNSALFAATYRLPPALRSHVAGHRVAVVDDVISAGSSVRATVAALEQEGASTTVIGALMLLGDRASPFFEEQQIPIENLERRPFQLWTPDRCPLCSSDVPLEDPRETDRLGNR
jgi:orotate phosphoribosyltransferase